MSNVYVLNRNVKSGQVLTADMFNLKSVPTSTIPSGATTDIYTTLSSYSLCDSDGRSIYYNVDSSNGESQNYYYVMINNEKKPIYVTDASGKDALAVSLQVSDNAFFYTGNNTGRTDIKIMSNAVVAKLDMAANTVITTSFLGRADSITTSDLRKEEYNVISLPVDLQPDEYVDIRLRLPSGQDYIVVSKKKVTIPVSNGAYLADTIQMNLTEDEILLMSAAIVENFEIAGSQLRATRYVEAGNQSEATVTYFPSNEIVELINRDPNIVQKAIAQIQNNAQTIRDGINKSKSDNGTPENIKTKIDESTAGTLEERKNYLQTLTAY